MTKIKICGLTRPVDIEYVNGLEPEFIGFVFFEKSIRYVTLEKAAQLKKRLNKNIKAVGVFLDNELSLVRKLAENDIIDIIQLHGSSMDEEFIAELRKITDKTIIRAFSIETKEDILKAEESSADYVLLDSGKGGTGLTFDWDLIKGIKRPYFLAGGLNPENISDAVNNLKPFAVDVSSGVETDKVKDPAKIESFITAVRKPG